MRRKLQWAPGRTTTGSNRSCKKITRSLPPGEAMRFLVSGNKFWACTILYGFGLAYNIRTKFRNEILKTRVMG